MCTQVALSWTASRVPSDRQDVATPYSAQFRDIVARPCATAAKGSSRCGSRTAPSCPSASRRRPPTRCRRTSRSSTIAVIGGAAHNPRRGTHRRSSRGSGAGSGFSDIVQRCRSDRRAATSSPAAALGVDRSAGCRRCGRRRRPTRRDPSCRRVTAVSERDWRRGLLAGISPREQCRVVSSLGARLSCAPRVGRQPGSAPSASRSGVY